MSGQIDLLAEQQQAAPVALNTSHAREMLRARFAPPEWAFMEEVAPRTGGGTRYADGIAVNLWSSRGHAIHGFEIKVSRSDWLRELKQPEKADELVGFCDYWWIVAPAGVVKDGELPPTWGLFELRATGIVQKVAAPKLQPKPISRAFFASLMRRGFESLEHHARALMANERRELHRQAEEDRKRIRKEAEGDLAALQKKVADFEAQTGLEFGSRWSGPPVSAIKIAQRLGLLDGYRGEPLGKLKHIAEDLERATTTIREALAAVNDEQPATGEAAA